MNSWKPSTQPPQGNKHQWSPEVVVITNLGNVFLLSYFQGVCGGCWQRPRAFVPGETVAFWIEQPKTEGNQ